MGKCKRQDVRPERRRFAKSVAAALISAPLLTTHRGEAQAKQAATAQSAPSTAAKASALVEAYAEVARARFGQQLTSEEMDRLKRELDGYARSSERLRAFKLKNSDEPDFIFRA